MSKIYVDMMPTEPFNCPFSIMGKYIPDGYGVNAHYEYNCPFDYGELCDIENGGTCKFLTELPKGDKANGSSQD